MGLAALFVGGMIALAIAVAIVYGIFVGLVRFGRFLWRLVVGPEAQLDAVATEGGSRGPPCWEDKDCPETARQSFPAFLGRDGLPCWLANLRVEGHLRVDCLTCRRFNLAELLAA